MGAFDVLKNRQILHTHSGHFIDIQVGPGRSVHETIARIRKNRLYWKLVRKNQVAPGRPEDETTGGGGAPLSFKNGRFFGLWYHDD